MPKNSKSSKNAKSKAKASNESTQELILKEDGQEYGQIVKNMGSNMQVQCFDGKTRIGHIRGKLRGRNFIHAGDLVLVGMRGFELADNKCDIILKYTDTQAKRLKQLGELPDNFTVVSTETKTDDDIPFDFEEI
jgi:translation initiation factor 1A